MCVTCACFASLCLRVCVPVCVYVCVHKKQTNKNVISLTNKIDFYCIPLATFDIALAWPALSLSLSLFVAVFSVPFFNCLFAAHVSLFLSLPACFLFISPVHVSLEIHTCLAVTLHLSIAASRFAFVFTCHNNNNAY